jgi:MoxR-like ATPase
VFAARKEIDAVSSVEAVERYIVALVAATRRPSDFGDKLKRWITIGASPRGSLALDACSRAYAWLEGRTYATPEDVQAIVHDCLRHRVSLSYEASADGMRADDVIDELVKQVAVAV